MGTERQAEKTSGTGPQVVATHRTQEHLNQKPILLTAPHYPPRKACQTLSIINLSFSSEAKLLKDTGVCANGCYGRLCKLDSLQRQELKSL